MRLKFPATYPPNMPRTFPGQPRHRCSSITCSLSERTAAPWSRPAPAPDEQTTGRLLLLVDPGHLDGFKNAFAAALLCILKTGQRHDTFNQIGKTQLSRVQIEVSFLQDRQSVVKVKHVSVRGKYGGSREI